MNNRILSLLAGAALGFPAAAQYAPQAPLPGHEGILYSSPSFQDWASGCTLYRGWLDIADKPAGQPSIGAESDVYGIPDAGVLSLGDSGVAVLTFDYPVYNGGGPDFAVFENAFANPVNDSMAFLELAFVEVSSDGQHFFRFPASSAMQDSLQIDNFTYSDARRYHNLAGKYIAPYGTPFDLEELKGIPGLDVNHITHIRLVDVVGSLDPQYASLDKDERRINDPYPSAYSSGGFDLRGIGVLHSQRPSTGTGANPGRLLAVKIYPNPAVHTVQVQTSDPAPLHYRLCDIQGKTIAGGLLGRERYIEVSRLAAGLYLLYLDNGHKQHVQLLHKQ